MFRPLFAAYEYVLFSIYKLRLNNILHTSQDYVFVPLSKYVKNELAKDGILKSKMQVIYNISSMHQAPKLARKQLISFAGALDKSKGIWDVIKGFELSNQKKL